MFLRRVRVVGRRLRGGHAIADACLSRSYTACACGTKPRRGPLAALPGEDVWRHVWCEGAHCPCVAHHAANDNIFPMAVRDQAQLFQREGWHRHAEFLFSPAAISAESPLYCSGFCSKLRAPHRGTSLSSCVRGADYRLYLYGGKVAFAAMYLP
jgi:hypothetical protein